MEALEWIHGVHDDLVLIAEEEQDTGGLMGGENIDWIYVMLRKVKALRKRKTSLGTAWFADYTK